MAERQDELRDEYDIEALAGIGVWGKHAAAFRRGSNIVVLEPDVASVFHDAAAVNAALWLLIRAAAVIAPGESGS